MASLRRQLGVVSQETILFHDTVRANIAYGLSGVSQADVEAAARAAHAHDFITRLPQGYETMIGDRGVLLSGGERQRSRDRPRLAA
jgi:ABC-type multidrug transport system fused ATPase/permease subunit